MSIKYKLENAFRQVIEEGLEAGEHGTLQVLTSLENQQTTLETRRVIINAKGGAAVTPKSRTLRYRVEVMYERSADRQEPDTEAPEQSFSHECGIIHRILEDQETPLADLLSAARDTVGPFTCFLVSLVGEIDADAPAGSRMFRDVWAYDCTVCESDNT